MHSAGPHDLPVERTRDRIDALERHAARIRTDRHPMARTDWIYAKRAAADLRCDLEDMGVQP